MSSRFCCFGSLPVEMTERVVLETAVARWVSTQGDLNDVLRDLSDVSDLWAVIVGGAVFRRDLSSRIVSIVRAGN